MKERGGWKGRETDRERKGVRKRGRGKVGRDHRRGETEEERGYTNMKSSVGPSLLEVRYADILTIRVRPVHSQV